MIGVTACIGLVTAVISLRTALERTSNLEREVADLRARQGPTLGATLGNLSIQVGQAAGESYRRSDPAEQERIWESLYKVREELSALEKTRLTNAELAQIRGIIASIDNQERWPPPKSGRYSPAALRTEIFRIGSPELYLQLFDRDGNGVLVKRDGEWPENIPPDQADNNRDGILTLDEIIAATR